MRLGAFEFDEPLPELKEPHALTILRPWIDVGSVGTLTLSWLEEHSQAKPLAKLARPGNFFDFTRYRPTLYRREGRRHVIVPNSYVSYGKQAPGFDFLFLHLLEPHMLGEVYVESILRLLATFGVRRYCLLGSMYDFVPHTRPLLVTGGAVGKTAEQELDSAGIMPSDYEGPTTITYLVSQRLSEMGIESMSMIVHMPQYTQLDEDYTGATRLMEVLSSLYGISVDEVNIEKAEQQHEQISAAVAKNPQLTAIVEQLEAHYDARPVKRREERETSALSPEVEEFLREMERRFRQG